MRRSLERALTAGLLGVLLATALGAQTRGLPKPAKVERAFERLEPEQQLEVVEWYRYEMSTRPTAQAEFVRHVLEKFADERDPGTWPAVAAAPHYDPATHTPGEGAVRNPVDPASRDAERARKKLFKNVPERRLQRGYLYDWGSGELRRVDDEREVERAFRNALAGFVPDLDLAEALLERWLDDGEMRDELRALSHAYVSRNGDVFGGLTLYDAWASGQSFELPDVDVLGLVHDLEGEWRKWKAPLSPSKQRKLYERIEEEFFVPAHRHRGLRTALARTYLIGAPAMRDGYGPNLDRLHALWEYHEASPETLRDDLPRAKKWERYLESWVKRCDRDEDLLARGTARRLTLEAEAQAAYAQLVSILEQIGAL